MIVVNYFQGMHGSRIGAVELAFIYNTDGISGKHTVAAFQRCLGNIKGIRFFIAQESDLIAGKILKFSTDFIHIDTGTFRIDVLNGSII